MAMFVFKAACHDALVACCGEQGSGLTPAIRSKEFIKMAKFQIHFWSVFRGKVSFEAEDARET